MATKFSGLNPVRLPCLERTQTVSLQKPERTVSVGITYDTDKSIGTISKEIFDIDINIA
jgi:hypothetical protein